MNPEELKKLEEQFPQTVGVKLILVPWIESQLSSIERSWHNMSIDEMETKAIEKKLLLRLMRDLKLQPDTLQADNGNSSDSVLDAGT